MFWSNYFLLFSRSNSPVIHLNIPYFDFLAMGMISSHMGLCVFKKTWALSIEMTIASA